MQQKDHLLVNEFASCWRSIHSKAERVPKMEKPCDGEMLHHFSSSFTHFVCSIFCSRNYGFLQRSLNIDFCDSPVARWPIWMAPGHWDKETLNKLEVCAIRDFSRRAVNCTIMVSYISLLLTGRHHAQKTQRANEIFYTSESRALRNWSDFYADYSSCLQTHLTESFCFVTANSWDKNKAGLGRCDFRRRS